MPVVFRDNGIRFFFFSNEGNPREPVHIHVRSPGREAKFWLYPQVELSYNQGFSNREIIRLIALIRARRHIIGEVWYDYFG